jgi:sulfonate transport system ATP-binding protein
MSQALTITGVRRAFKGRVVLDGLDVSIPEGQFAALLGQSGTGKSHIYRIIAGLDTEYEGEVCAPEGRAVVFQDPCLMPWKRVRTT